MESGADGCTLVVSLYQVIMQTFMMVESVVYKEGCVVKKQGEATTFLSTCHTEG